jgi:hydroxymethylpyrimidine/phosphomethylpyrimidine kinase
VAPPVVISIAGSDSGGGAGIQADLKAFANAGVHGTTAITALTAQNTAAVESVAGVDPEMIRAQIAAVAGDIGIDAVKIGMLGTAAATEAVAGALDELGLAGSVPIVVDPVMVAESGAVLLDPDARAALIERLLPLATVATPNLPEARELTGLGAGADREELATAVLSLGPGAVIVTGGHTEDGADLLVTASGVRQAIAGPRHPDGAAHGSGCTHSSTLAAQLALGLPLDEAARVAREVTGEAVRHGLRDLGAGAGPVDVLHTPKR